MGGHCSSLRRTTSPSSRRRRPRREGQGTVSRPARIDPASAASRASRPKGRWRRSLPCGSTLGTNSRPDRLSARLRTRRWRRRPGRAMPEQATSSARLQKAGERAVARRRSLSLRAPLWRRWPSRRWLRWRDRPSGERAAKRALLRGDDDAGRAKCRHVQRVWGRRRGPGLATRTLVRGGHVGTLARSRSLSALALCLSPQFPPVNSDRQICPACFMTVVLY
mmetsp:Transcript_13344/g.41961  ORF Transcript_13344/g.41961 Transcript_13344/m.41961 type:complete len:222 (+) Transcript_13344:260-925(+)